MKRVKKPARARQQNKPKPVHAQKNVKAAGRKDVRHKIDHLSRQVIRNLPVGVAVYDRNLRCEMWNQFMEEVTGIPAEKMIGQLPLADFPFLRQMRVEDELRQVLAGKPSAYDDAPYMSPVTGQMMWLSGQYALMRDASGRMTNVIVKIRDVTDTKKAEQALRHNEARFRQATTAAHIGIFDRDLLTDVVYRSPEMWELFGFAPDKHFDFSVFLESLHPDDREAVLQAHQRMLDPAENGLFDLEFRIVRSDGEIRWVDCQAQTSFEDIAGTPRPVRTIGAMADISERKWAEEKISASERQLRQILDSVFGVIALYTVEGAVVFVNQAAFDATGVAREEVMGKLFWETPWWDYDPRVQAELRAAMARAAKGEIVRYVTRASTKDGALFDVDCTFSPMRAADGSVTGIVGFGVDVTERRRAEMSLRGSEERFRQLAENIPQVFWIVDIGTGETVYVSPAYESVWGRSRQSLYQRPEEWLEAIHPEDRQRVEQVYASALQGGAFEQEYRIVRPDGQVRWIQDRGFPVVDDHAKLYRMTGIATDITEQKLAGQELQENQRRLTEAQRIVHMGSWESDLVSGAVTWSDEMYRIFEIAPQDFDGSFEALLRTVHPDDRERLRQAYPESIARRIPYDVTYRIQMNDGSIKWVQAYARTEYDADGTPLRVLGTTQDITERALTEQQLRENQQRLAEAQRIGHMGSWERNLLTGDLIWSDQAYKIFEVDRQSPTPSYEQFESMVYPEDRERIRQARAESFARNIPFDVTFRLQISDGRIKWVRAHGTTTEYSADGTPVRSLGTVQDITEQKLTEQELQENQRRLTEAQRIGRMGSWERNLVTGDLVWSDQTYKIFEVDRQSSTPSYEQFMSIVHQEDRESVQQARAESISRKIPNELSYRLKMSDGRIKWVQSYSTTEYSADGTPLRTSGTIQDITGQKLAEWELRENQRRLVEAQRIGRMGSWERNLVTNDLAWSDQTYKIFEIDAQSSAPSYEQFLSIVHREDRERVQQVSAESFARNVPYELTYRLKMSDGRTKWVQAYATTEYSAEGAPLRIVGTVQDITEQKLAEWELRENQRRLMEAQRIGRMGSWERDLTTNEYIWSAQAYQIFEGDPQGAPPNYAMYLNMIHDEDRDRMDRTFQESVGRKIPYEISYRLKMSDGRIKWVQVYATSEYSAEGKPLRVAGTIQDITEQKLTEQALRENQRRLLEAQRIGRMGSWELDLITNRLTWSAEIYRMFEIDPERFGASYEAFLNVIYPDDREMVNKAFTESVARKEPYEITHRLRMPDGRIKWAHERGVTEYSADGAPVRSTGTVQDITELRLAEQSLQESESRFAGIIGSAMDAIITVDGKHNILLFNNAAERIFGYTAAEIIGQPLARLIPARFNAAHRQHIESFERTGVTARSMGHLGTISGMRANGQEFPIEASISQLDIGGQKNYTVILRDITERKRAEQQIAESLREKEIVLREIHHRVKNNLQIISSLLHFHSNKVAGAQAKAVFLDGQDRLRSMILVHDKLYRSEHFASVDFADYVNSLAQELVRSNQTQSSNIDLTVEVENISLPVEIAPPCGMILTELLTNVFKYAFPEGRRGKALIRVTNEGGRLVMTVQDDGIGFEEGSTGTAGSFGLELVRGLAEQLNGTVRIASGNGTTVTLQIPIRSPVHAN